MYAPNVLIAKLNTCPIIKITAATTYPAYGIKPMNTFATSLTTSPTTPDASPKPNKREYD